jgi:hypothetical protein
MNERIKQLLNEATSGHEQEYDALKWLTVSDKEMDKFAELIVRECVDVGIKDFYNHLPNIFPANAIKKHFGVEE